MPKLKLFFAFFAVFLLAGFTFSANVVAVDGVIDESINYNADTVLSNLETPTNNDAQASNLTLTQTTAPLSIASADTENTLSWPAIPGESLNDIARSFYPKSPLMRQHFVRKTLALNTDISPKLQANKAFEEPTLLTIPTLQSLSRSVQKMKAANRKKAQQQDLSMSYRINQISSKIPAFLIQEYQALLAKNAFLKAELDRLHVKLGVLQAKLGNLKLIFDKTLALQPDVPAQADLVKQDGSIKQALEKEALPPEPPKVAVVTQAEAQTDAPANLQETAPSAKKVFKNLNDSAANTPANSTTRLNPSLGIGAEAATNSPGLMQYKPLFLVLGLLLLLALLVLMFKKYRQRVVTKFGQSLPDSNLKPDDTYMQYSPQWQDTQAEPEPANYVVEHDSEPASNNFMNTEMRDEHAQALTTLEEAKLLISINRTQEAIAHLKLSIETQPKSSINHWLYLLEIFRKLNLKDEFTQYAQSLHLTFNVMTPVWYETNMNIVVPQQLEDFPHIVEKLTTVWPSALAQIYLRSLITDNRNGERTGFSKSVLDQILMLIALLDTRKDFESPS